MSDFKELKAEYIALAGKNPPPMSADALRSKVEALRAAAQPGVEEVPVAEASAVEQPAAEQPVAEPAAETPAAEQPEAPSEEPAAAEQSVEDACAELGLAIEADGQCAVEMTDSVAGALHLSRGDPYRFEAAEAVRAVRAGIAKPRS